MRRTLLLGLVGLVLAVAVGLGVHVLTRGTISLPVVRLDPAPALAPPRATTATTARPTTSGETEPPVSTGATTDDSGRGRGRGRSGGSDDGPDDD